MKITPITKKYTAQLSPVSQENSLGTSKNKNIFICPKTIVKNTLNKFSNSRNEYLANIDLTDAYIPERKKQNESQNQKTIVKNTINPYTAYFLADMDLADCYELPNKNNSNISFKGIYPQFLIDQDAVEQYETTSNGIKDIAFSSYCSKENEIDDSIKKVCNVIKQYLPLK